MKKMEPESINNSKNEEDILKEAEVVEETSAEEKECLAAQLQEINDKYLRLYAEFENYKKRANKDKDELIKYANEQLISQLLTVMDNLEMALKHSDNNISLGLVKGVENTLREFQRILEKFGLIHIDALNKPFDPSLHEAMSVVECEDMAENMVVEEFRRGYIFKEKVLRPSLVSVSKKPEIKREEVKVIEEGS
ncbi:MAG: nucleotide exchange factor GrpE [Nitrospirae bacterium]|nr:nucleotide exchange factor GrpE [Nitrospirota bacterium]